MTSKTLQDADERRAIIEDLHDIDAVEMVEVEETEDGLRLRIRTRGESIPAVVMGRLSEADLSIEPKGPGEFFAQPERSGLWFNFTPEIWGLIIQQYEHLDAIIGDPVEMAKSIDELMGREEFDWDSFEEAAQELRDTRDVWAIFVDRLDDDLRDTLREFAPGSDEDFDVREHLGPENIEKAHGSFGGVRLIEADRVENLEAEKAEEEMQEISDSILPNRGTKLRLVFDTLLDIGPATSEDVIGASGYENAQPALSKLKQKELIEVVDTKFRSGEPRRNVWGVTDKARGLVEEASG